MLGSVSTRFVILISEVITILPLRFEYATFATGVRTNTYVTILGQLTHHYTKANFYRIRLEYDTGNIEEKLVRESELLYLLTLRVDEE